MTRIKSAFEKAMERAESLGEPTSEEKLRFKFIPEGERLGAAYLRSEIDLKEALEDCSPEARPYLAKGICEVLIHNLRLGRTETEQKSNELALEGLRLVKTEKHSVEEVASVIRNICNTFLLYHKEGLHQTYQETKVRFQQRAREALKQYTGVDSNLNVNVESMPEFQQEWARVASEFNSRYQAPLEEQKTLLLEIS